MKLLNKRIEEPEDQIQDVVIDVEEPENEDEPETKEIVAPKKKRKGFKVFVEIVGGDVLSKDGFVGLFPFFLYVVFLLMVYITNVYAAEDMSREVARLNRKVEDLHVEYVYLESEITKITKQSNMVKMLKNKGIKEPVEPLRKIVVKREGGGDE